MKILLSINKYSDLTFCRRRCFFLMLMRKRIRRLTNDRDKWHDDISKSVQSRFVPRSFVSEEQMVNLPLGKLDVSTGIIFSIYTVGQMAGASVTDCNAF